MRDPWKLSILSLVPLTVWNGGAAAQSAAQPATTEPVPVVVAVDTSRSLYPAELADVVKRLRRVLGALPEDAPAALLAFDDEPRWLRRPGVSLAAVDGALGELALDGNFTLLHDALFVAVRELPTGGVILLATDGRDENSATTVEDIARRCEAQDVRIVSLGAGRRVEERSLRRLALLSNGAYLGSVTAVAPTVVVGAVVAARDEIRDELEQSARAAEERRAERQAISPADASEAPRAAGNETESWVPDRTRYPWTLAALALLALAVVALFRLRARRLRPDYCPDCGMEIEPDQLVCEHCKALELRTELANHPAAAVEQAAEVTVDTAVFHQLSLDEKLEKTQVLSNHSVLLVKKTGESPRSFLLVGDQAFAVGRERDGNTLTVPDPSLSARHFKIVPKGESFYFVDLESTNGSFVNGVRVPVKELRSGDVIRAGQVEFEFKSHADL